MAHWQFLNLRFLICAFSTALEVDSVTVICSFTDLALEGVSFFFIGIIMIWMYNNVLNLMFVVPYILVIYMFNSGPTRCKLYSLFLSSLALNVSGAFCTHHQEHNYRVQP
jgi:hypothetical protein